MENLQEYYKHYDDLKNLIIGKFKENIIDTIFDLDESFIFEYETCKFSLEFKNKDILFFGIDYKWDYSIEFKYSGHFQYEKVIDHDESNILGEVERVLNLFIAEFKKAGDNFNGDDKNTT